MKTVTENIKPIIALMVLTFSFTYFFLVAFTGIKADPQILIAIVGTLGVVTGYYFGTSQGSQKKDDLINSLSKKD